MAEAHEHHADDAGARGFVSERGPFAIWENPAIKAPYPSAKVDPDKAAAGFDYSDLAERVGEEPARKAVGEMVGAISDGAASTTLFWQGGDNGMSLVHVWFGPNFPLFRHSHPRYGDCLYYVVAGEILLGRRRLGPGSGFFLPNGMPCKYTAGPAGVELLEFRAGGGDPDAPGMKLDEHSLASLAKIVEGANANRDNWQVPEHIGDTALRQAELEFD